MTWYYERDRNNDRLRLRFVDDSGTTHGPRDVPWGDRLTVAADGWPVEPNLKEAAGEVTTDLATSVNITTGLMALRDLAAGKVEEGTPP
jgi:hypothetical protein